jgi:hypothetical protein
MDCEKINQKDIVDVLIKSETELREFIKVENGTIILDGYYEIENFRCANYESILSWVMHLSEKIWMDNRKLNRFIDIACAINNLERPRENRAKQ